MKFYNKRIGSEKLKVLHLTMSFHMGGAEKLLVDFINQSKEVDSRICIVNNEYDNELLKKIDKRDKVILLNRPEKSKNILFFIKLMVIINKLKPDVIHCHSTTSFKLANIIKLFFKNIKVIYTIHGTKIITKHVDIIKAINKKCDKVIAISNVIKNECLDMGIQKEKILVIYNGIEIEQYNLPKKEHKSINIVCVARIVPLKGHDILIKAFSKLKKQVSDSKLFFVGDVPSKNAIKDNEYKNQLEQIIGELKLQNDIQFCGNISNVPEFFRNMDILVLPSRQEGFGLVIIEAMAARLGVVASNIEGPKEILKNKYGYMFEVENDNDLFNKIHDCINNTMNISLEDSYRYVEKKYSIESMCREYKNVYCEVLDKF